MIAYNGTTVAAASISFDHGVRLAIQFPDHREWPDIEPVVFILKTCTDAKDRLTVLNRWKAAAAHDARELLPRICQIEAELALACFDQRVEPETA